MKTKPKAPEMYTVWNIENTGKIDIVNACYGSSIKVGDAEPYMKSVVMFRGTLPECKNFYKVVTGKDFQ